MTRWIFGLLAAASGAILIGPGAARADDKLQYGPVPDWVKPVEIPKTSATDDKEMFRALLVNAQARYRDGAQELYTERAIKVLKPEALQIGNVNLPWDPSTDTLIIHRVNIIRDGKTIDVLKSGQTFQVFRREPNLEASILDGRLTASMQPEGIEVGDIVDIAITIIHRDPTFKGHMEGEFQVPAGFPVDRVYVRAEWPATVDLKWKATPDLDKAVVTKTAAGTDVTVDMKNVKLPFTLPPPLGSGVSSQLQFSDYADWPELSRIIAPLFDKASTLQPDSPLKAEAAKIAAASPDPKVRAGAALKLVQSQVRYVFYGMDLGGYVPADADLTWRRRFGDCKAKTALLLALLKELHIEAEPTLVSSRYGREVEKRLPGVHAFDHVMVRAVIGGKTYWLDGTRSGDDDIDFITTPRFENSLPVSAAGSPLESLVAAQPDKPLHEYHFTIDASAGLDAPAAAHLERIYRGDAAVLEAKRLVSAKPDEADKLMRQRWRNAVFGAQVDAAKTSFTYDRATGELRESLDGAVALNWKAEDKGRRELRADHSSIIVLGAPFAGPMPVFAPPAAADAAGEDVGQDIGQAPPAVMPIMPDFNPFPLTLDWTYEAMDETIILPRKGAGFTVDGGDVSKTAGGWQFYRTAALKDGVFTLKATSRNLQRVFSKADVEAASKAVDGQTNAVLILAPDGYKDGDAEALIERKRTPATVLEFRARAQVFEKAHKGDDAMKAVEGAVRIDAKDPENLNYRCFLRAEMNRELKGALEDCNAAIGLFPNSGEFYDSRALVYYRMGQFDLALKDYEEALKRDPTIASSVFMRGVIRLKQGDTEKGDADIDKALSMDSDVAGDYAGWGVTPPKTKPSDAQTRARPPVTEKHKTISRPQTASSSLDDNRRK